MKRNKTSRIEIPDDVIPLILSSLPVKSLLRFRCVSKTWCSLIDGKEFIKNHLQVSTKNPNFTNHNIVIKIFSSYSSSDNLHYYPCEYLMSEACGEIHSTDLNYSCEHVFSDLFDHIVGCCNGLCCAIIAAEDKSEYILLSNPATQKYIKFETSERLSYICDYHGFGFDDSTDDYKIFLGNRKQKGIILLYSFKSNKFTKLNDFPPKDDKGGIIFNTKGIFVEGKLHWLMRYDNDVNNIKGLDIVCFNLKTEMFGGVIDKPFYIKPKHSSSTIEVLRGCLCAVLTNHQIRRSDVWILKQYGVKESWVKLVSIPYCVEDTFQVPRVLCMTEDGEIMFGSRLFFYIYDPNKDTSPRRIKSASFSQLDICVQSLVSPKVTTSCS